MNPVIGLDVSKGESHAQAFADRGAPYGKIFHFRHDLEGLASFLRFAQDLESFTGKRATVVLEAKGHYHSSVVQFLEEHQYLHIVINPLLLPIVLDVLLNLFALRKCFKFMLIMFFTPFKIYYNAVSVNSTNWR